MRPCHRLLSSPLTIALPHMAAICMEIHIGRLSEASLRPPSPPHSEFVSSESQHDSLPTAAAFLLTRINVPPFHGRWGTVEVRRCDLFQARTSGPWHCPDINTSAPHKLWVMCYGEFQTGSCPFPGESEAEIRLCWVFQGPIKEKSEGRSQDMTLKSISVIWLATWRRKKNQTSWTDMLMN